MSHAFDSRVRALSAGFALAALGTAASVHAQTTLYVDSAAPAGGDGQQWSSALRDLQDALFLADHRPDRSLPTEIRIAHGVYTPDSGTLQRNASFVLNSGVTLLGGFAGFGAPNPDENDPARFVSVLSGDLNHNDAPGISTRTDNSKTVITVRNSPGAITGLSIRAGVSAIHQTGLGHLVISACAISDNNSSELNNSMNPLILAVVNLRDAAVQNCVFSDNFSSQFSTLYLSSTTLKSCVIAGNSCVRTAGQTLILTPAELGYATTLDTCLIADNVASDYGLFCEDVGVSLYSCTIVDNHAGSGAGLYSTSNSAALTNCILSHNTSSADAENRQIQASGFLSISSCLLDRGTADIDSTGGIISSTGLLSGDPHFMNAAGPDGNAFAWHDNDYRLAASSPCIDHADTSPAVYTFGHTDLLGHGPTDDPSTPNLGLGPISYFDIGAYEFLPNPCRADFDASGSLTPQDIFDFLSAWFALAPSADFNHSGSITTQDIFDFLSAWFSGC